MINLKLVVSLNRIKYSKFNQKVLKAFLECLHISQNREGIEAEEWEEIIKYINQNQSNILNDVTNLTNVVENDTFEKNQLWESRKHYFGETPTEAVLFKYCLNSKEIKLILQFLFSVYNYFKDLRRRRKKFQHSQTVQQQEHSETSRDSSKRPSLLRNKLRTRFHNSIPM